MSQEIEWQLTFKKKMLHRCSYILTKKSNVSSIVVSHEKLSGTLISGRNLRNEKEKTEKRGKILRKV